MASFDDLLLEQSNIQRYIETSERFFYSHLEFGTTLYDKISKKGLDVKQSDIILSLFFREILETLDGIRVLYNQNCIKPAYPLVRTLFELYLEFKFLLSDKTQIEQKATVYELWLLQTELKDKHNDKFQDMFDSYTDEYSMKIKKQLNKSTHFDGRWYEIFDSTCSSIKKLAKAVDEESIYNKSYKLLSKHTHGYLPRYRLISNDGENRFEPLRSPMGAYLNVFLCNLIMMNSFNIYASYYMDPKEFSNEFITFLKDQTELSHIIERYDSMFSLSFETI